MVEAACAHIVGSHLQITSLCMGSISMVRKMDGTSAFLIDPIPYDCAYFNGYLVSDSHIHENLTPSSILSLFLQCWLLRCVRTTLVYWEECHTRTQKIRLQTPTLL